MKISTSTIVRSVCLALALGNQILSATGHAVLPIEDAQIETLITTGLTVVTSVVSWWKNNSITPEAIQADEYLETLRSNKG